MIGKIIVWSVNMIIVINEKEYNRLDEWQNGTTTYILGQDTSSDIEWYAVRAEETGSGLEGTYTHEYDTRPSRGEVENTHGKMITKIVAKKRKIEMELELNRAWIYDKESIENDEPIGERNFVISGEYFISIFYEIFPNENIHDFLDYYEPEKDGEMIYQRAKADGKIIEEQDDLYEGREQDDNFGPVL